MKNRNIYTDFFNKDLLTLAEYEVETISNSIEGVKYSTKFKPDLIICDIVMPNLDGLGVLHELSKNPGTMNIPFIFLTAKSELTDIRKGMELGADDYLAKPFNPSDLLRAVELRLSKRRKILDEQNNQQLCMLTGYILLNTVLLPDYIFSTTSAVP